MKSDFVLWAAAPPSWITSAGRDLDGTVISSRVRLARNFLGIPFPHHASAAIQKKSLEKTFDVLKASNVLQTSHAFHLNQLSPLERKFLMERQLISHEHAEKEAENGLVVSAGEHVSVMINEEDHIRAACFKPGLGLQEAWEVLSELDDELASKLPFSYSQEFGYVTTCPTNIGTGLRASCLLHLPALVLTGKIQMIISELTHNGLTARGFYGEGTMALGDLFQISNACTLGQTEAQIIKDVEEAVQEICSLEKKEEQTLQSSEYRLRTEDKTLRAFGTLRYARLLNHVEGMEYLSHFRLGLKMKLDMAFSIEKVTNLFFLAQPAHLQIRNQKPSANVGDEILRSEFIRAELKNA